MKYILVSLVILLFSGCGPKIPTKTVVNVGDKDGLIDSNGDVVIKPIYKRVERLNGPNEKYGHHNYVNIHWFHDDSDLEYAIVTNIDNKKGIINTKGELQLKVIYDSISSFINGFSRIELNGKFGLIDKEFNIVLKPIYDEVDEFIFNTAIVVYKGKFGCIDKAITMKIKPIYDHIYFHSEEMKRTELDDKWGFIDIDCNVIVKPIYDYAFDFSNGFAKVKNANKWSYIDKSGALMTNTIFTDPDNF